MSPDHELIPLEELNRRFAIADVAQIVADDGGLPKVRVTTPSAAARCACMAHKSPRGSHPRRKK